jgi:quinol monooxygenase YgiN
MLVVRATFPIDPDRHDESLELIKTLAEHSNEEEGVIDYQVATDVDDPNIFRFFEQYEDEAAFEAHAKTDHFQEFEASLPDLLAGEPEVTQFDIEESSTVEV